MGTQKKLISTVLDVEKESVTTDPLIMPEFLQTRRKNEFCPRREVLRSSFGRAPATADKGYWSRTQKFDVALQRVLPKQSPHRVQYLVHYPVIAGQ